MYTRQRDVSLMRKFNRELMGNIITQQAAFYQFKMEETKVNLYGEAAGDKYYNGPFLFNCLINREDQSYSSGDEGISFGQGIQFYFLRDDLVDANVHPEVGDVILIGRFKNKKVTVKTITYDEYGMPIINGRPACTFRISKKD